VRRQALTGLSFSYPCIEGLELSLGEDLFVAQGVATHLHLVELLSGTTQQIFRLRGGEGWVSQPTSTNTYRVVEHTEPRLARGV
jgi:hypothetical protein